MLKETEKTEEFGKIEMMEDLKAIKDELKEMEQPEGDKTEEELKEIKCSC